MANPARKFDEPRPEADPTLSPDPFNPMPPLTHDPVVGDRYANANDPRVVENRVDIQAERRTGTSVLIAAILLIFALIGYLVFASNPDTAMPPEGPAMTAPADPVAPAEPNAMAPADPAAPNAMAPAETAPDAAAPAEPAPAPATPAPAPAPVQ